MAKVASLTWVEAARPAAAGDSSAPLHSHFIASGNLDRLARALAPAPQYQTLANPLIPRDFLRKGRAAAAVLAGCREQSLPIRVISGMRDPVARSLSLFSFLADFCGHTTRACSGRNVGASVDAVVESLVHAWESVYSGDEPAASFEWMLYRMIGLFRTWFGEELLEPFGIDLYSAGFPIAVGALRLRSAGVDALIYRVEDMQPDAVAYDALRSAAAGFLESPLPQWPKVNQSESRRRTQAFNAQVRQAFNLPQHLLDAIYAEPVVRHFYSAEEIAAFRSRWSRAG